MSKYKNTKNYRSVIACLWANRQGVTGKCSTLTPKLGRALRAGAVSLLIVLGVGSGVAAVVTSVHPVRSAAAASASTLNFQARLMTAAGSIVQDGTYNVEFKLYSATASSGSGQGSCVGDANCLWVETDTSGSAIIVKNGFLTVSLGATTPFPTTINWDQQLWLAMRIGGTGTPSWDPEMSPRLSLTAIPYAFRAGQLAQLNVGNGFESTLSIVQPTVGNQIFQIPDQGAAGTYTLLTTTVANNAFVQLQGATPGTQQVGNLNISGAGVFGGALAVTGAVTGGTYNSQTISVAASFTGTINAATGYKVAGGAASGSFLRGNGTNFVSSALLASDLTAGSNNYLQNNGTMIPQAATLYISGEGSVSNLWASGTVSAGNTGADYSLMDYTGVAITRAIGYFRNTAGMLNVTASSGSVHIAAGAATGIYQYANGNTCFNTNSCGGTIGVSGTIRASSSITANTTPDLAETIAAAPDVGAADVVKADPFNAERVIKTDRAYDSAVVGVISDGSSSFMINSYGGDSGLNGSLTGKPLVLAGRVPVKITDEGGPVQPGDYLTSSSTPGYAMKATRTGPTIGKALGFFSGTTGTVLVLVSPGSYAPDGASAVQSTGELQVSGMANVANLNVMGQATLAGLVVTGSAQLSSLLVTGPTTVGGIAVNGHIVSGNTGNSLTTASAGPAACQLPIVRLTGNDTAGQLTVTTGKGCSSPGDVVSVGFASPYRTKPVVTLTPCNAVTSLASSFYDEVNSSNSVFEIATPVTLAPGTTYTWDYLIMQ